VVRFWTVLSLLFLTISCDQATKVIAREHLAQSEGHRFLGGLLSLQYTENPGAFLSMGAQFHETARFWIFTVVVGIVLAVAGYMLVKKKMDWITTIGLTLLIGGGIGNLIDRAVKGTVTDFLLMDFGFARTGIFNVADMVIMVGFGLLLIDSLKSKNERDTAAL
jgi:signal peptidase II